MLNAGSAGLLHCCRGNPGFVFHLRGIPEIRHEERSISALEARTQTARLDEISLHDLNAALLERFGRFARGVSGDDANCELVRGEQRVDDAAALSTGTTDDCDDLPCHVISPFVPMNLRR